MGSDTLDLTGAWAYRVGAEMPRLAGPTFVRWQPGGLYNRMIAPLLDFSIRGVIWYLGEADAGDAAAYAKTFPALIESWRVAWGQGDFPFLYVQVPNFQEETERPVQSNWAELRQAQRDAPRGTSYIPSRASPSPTSTSRAPSSVR